MTESTGNEDIQFTSNDVVRALGKSGAIIFLGTFLELALSFAAKLIVARSLLDFSYGEVAIGLTILTVFAIVSRLGIDTGIARIAPRYHGGDRRDVYLSAFLTVGISSFALASALYIGAPAIADFLGNQGLGPVLRIIAFGVPAMPVIRLCIGTMRAENRSGPKVIVQNLTHPVVRIGLVSAVALSGATPTRIATAYIISNWVAAALALWFVARTTTLFQPKWLTTPRFKELLGFSFPLMLSTGMAFIVAETDNLMIQYFLNSALVGSYDIAYTIGQTLTAAVGAFSYLFLPQVSSLHADGKWGEIRKLYQLVTKWIVFITLPPFIVMLLFPDAVIRYTFGSDYITAAPVLAIIASTYFVRAAAGPNRGLLSAIGSTRYIMYTNSSAAIGNIALNAVLIPSIGIVGGAVASFLSFGGLNLLYTYKLWREHGVFPLSKRAVVPAGTFSVAAVAVGGMLRASINLTAHPAILLGVTIAAAVGYAVCIFALGGLQPEDVMLVNSAEQRFSVDLGPVKAFARRLM